MNHSKPPWQPPAPPQGQISIHDILAMYNMFRNLPGEPSDNQKTCIANLEKVLVAFTASLSPGTPLQ
jgi:hypothetical protein